MFAHELALELKMPVGELFDRMSAHELLIEWPAYFRARQRMAEREEKRGAEAV